MSFPAFPSFPLKALQGLCDSGAWTRGRGLAGGDSVTVLGVERLAPNLWRIQGQVQGTARRPYDVVVQLAFDANSALSDWLGDCSCPVGAECKHAVALTLTALQDAAPAGAGPVMQRAKVSVSPPAKARSADMRARQQAAARAEADAQLEHWLSGWDNAVAPPGAALQAGKSPRTGAGAARPEQYVFLLSAQNQGVSRPAYRGAPANAVQRPALPELQLQAMVSYPKTTGGWIKPKPVRTKPAPGQAAYDRAGEAERQVLQLLGGMGDAPSPYYAVHQALPCAVLQGPLGVQALQLAAGTGFLFAADDGPSVGQALQWGEPLAISWAWVAVPSTASANHLPDSHSTDDDTHWALEARLPHPSALLCGNHPPLYIDTDRGLCGPVCAEGLSAAQLAVLLQTPVMSAAALQRYQAQIASRLGGVLPLPPMVPKVQRLPRVEPVARLHIAPVAEADVPHLGLLTAQLRFDYRGADAAARAGSIESHRMGWWAGEPLEVLVSAPDGAQELLQRDALAELKAIESLMDLGLLATDDGLFGIPGEQSQNDWMHWVDNHFAVFREAGFEVSVDAALNGWITHADTLDAVLLPQGEGSGAGAAGAAGGEGGEVGGANAGTSHTTAPWFALSLGVEVNGVRHNILPLLPMLIAAAAAQPADPVTGQPSLPPYVYLRARGDAGFVRLPTDALRPWMAALLELVGDRAHDFTGDSLRLSRMEALRTGAALGSLGNLGNWGEGTVWQGGEVLKSLLSSLQGGATLPVVPVPASVHATLRPYQEQGLNWLQFLRTHGLAGVLADDMGLGKTLQTLAHIQVEKDAGRLTDPALIIAPVSLMGNWAREAARFCPGLRCLVLHGADRHHAAGALADHDVVIAPYSLLHRDRERWLGQPWHLVVLDEAQNIKNASTHAAQVVAQLSARHRLCLSGTPMENHLGEIWSLFHFLMPGFLGSQQRFKEVFRNPIEKLGDTARLAQLRARITPFMLRRTKALVASELPPKVESVMAVALSGAQADLYETIRLGTEKAVREALQSKGLARSQITILDALLKLRQVCCDPQLVPLDAARKVTGSAKLEQLMALLPEMLAEGRRILLFSQFTSMLTLIEAELKKRGLPWVKLTGQSQRRDAIIERFTSGEVPLFLISLKAGGVGLNLPQADTVIHYDPWWNPAVENQATDRAHRMGQTQSVWVIKLVAQGTIEEHILALQERKAQLATSLYSGAAGRKEPLFSEHDVAQLLRPLS